jgi:3-deoxy-D-manno-octulosonate 8-phosphate phosphatase (KDO 8-P phosphatase)
MDKLDALDEAASEHGTSLDHAIYIGDDVLDLPAMAAAGIGATVPTAHPHVRQHADWTSTQPAGAGAVRELIDLVLSAQGHPISEMRPQPEPPPWR